MIKDLCMWKQDQVPPQREEPNYASQLNLWRNCLIPASRTPHQILVLLRHKAGSIDWLKQGTVLISFQGPAEICQCVYLCLVTLAAALPVARWEIPILKTFTTVGCQYIERVLQPWCITLPPVIWWLQRVLRKINFQNLCKLGCPKKGGKEKR